MKNIKKTISHAIKGREMFVSAVITRADGRIEDLGVISRNKIQISFWRIVLTALVLTALIGGAFALSAVLAGMLAKAVVFLFTFGFGATLIVNTGRAVSTALLAAIGVLAPKYMGWGTGAGTAGATDTTLFTEASETSTTRPTATLSQATTTTTNDTARFVATITVAGGNKTITNIGLFDANAAGNLFFKADFTGLALNIGDSGAFTVNIAQA